jgi:predicted transcriptional regulator
MGSNKGNLQTTQVGNSFLYCPTRPALQTLRRAADALLHNALEGTIGPLAAHMVKQSQLSADELAELRALLDERQDEGDKAKATRRRRQGEEPPARKGRS